jgi:hypothetical protein
VRPRILLAAGVVLAAALAIPAVAQPVAASTPSTGGIAFSTPTIVDPLHTWGEPDVGINPVDGTYYSSGPTGTGTQRSMWELSRDAGRTFRPLSPGVPPSALTGTNAPPGGGDTDIAFDHAGKQYFSDLYALSCFRMATTGDDGQAISEQPFPGGCAGQPPADRQWFAMFDPPGGVTGSAYRGPFPLLYLEYNDLTGGARWVASTDGLTFHQAGGGAACCVDGYPSVDQQTGQVLQVGSDNAGNLALNIGTADATGDLHFLDDPGGGGLITAVSKSWLAAHGDPNDLFPVSSIDRADNLWVFFVTENKDDPALQQIWVTVAAARTGWRTWAPPVQVSDGSTATGDAVNLMPWIKAGAAGWADGVWYGSGPGSDGKLADANADAGQAWNVFLGQLHWPVDSTGAVITTQRPQRSLVKVSPHPMHYNDVCENGTGCIEVQGNRNLADFFNLQLDSQGAAVIVYDDTSNQLLQPGAPTSAQAADHAGAPLVTIAHQSAGMGLYGHRVSGVSNAPVESFADSAHDARYPVVAGPSVPGMDLTNSSVALSADGRTLDVTMKVADLSDVPGTTLAVQAPLLSYVTRWTLHSRGQDLIYYAEMETDATGASPQFYAGQAQSVDLCSVSACFPHVITYPEFGPGSNSVSGAVDCAAKPCTITIHVPVADVGSPSAGSLLEEIGAYSFAESHPQAALTNAQAQLDNVPLEVDGACCYNYRAASLVRTGGGGVIGDMLGAVANAFGFGKGNLAPGSAGAQERSDGQTGSGAAGPGGSASGTGPGARSSGTGSPAVASARTAAPGALAGGAAVLVLLLGLAGWMLVNRRAAGSGTSPDEEA